ncbi:MAG: tail fiber domain-containing protein [Bacteroidetes bacterium]|nr:tail fiber domain-containing protein [Bacteroidota bacterium]
MKTIKCKLEKICLLALCSLLSIHHSVNAQYNYFAGTSAGAGNNSLYTSAIGYQALSSGNTGISNLAVGYWSLKANTTGYHNCAIGNGSMQYNTTGFGNTSLGTVSLVHLTTGYRNTAVGNFSLWSTEAGSGNTAVGAEALKLNVNAYFNTALGAYSLQNSISGYNNTASGYKSMNMNLIGFENCAYGHFAMFTTDSTMHNNAFGAYSLYFNKGKENCAYGTYSLNNNSSGNSNSAFGHSALSNNTTGYQNAVFGDYAADHNTTGYYNSALGSNALHLTANSNNTVAIGFDAAGKRSKYVKCTFIGTGADASANNLTNAMALGYNASVNASNKVRIGNTSITSIGGQVGWTTSSDKRLKANIKQSSLGLEFILRLNPVTYNFKEEGLENVTYTGLIAQEVDEAAKKDGVDYSGVDKNGEFWGIRYGDLTVPIIKGMQDQQQIIERQQAEISELKSMVQELAKRINPAGDASAAMQKLNSTAQPAVEIYPNPAHDQVSIKISLNFTEEKILLNILDAAGKLVKSFMVDSKDAVILCNTTDFTAGNYLIQLSTSKAIISTHQLIVN